MYNNYVVKVKVKCTLVRALRLCTGRTAQRGSRGIALPFLDHGTKRGWGVSVTPRPLFTPGKDPVPIVQEAGWAPGPVWTGVENLAPTGIQSPDRPAHSQSLYCLRYPVHNNYILLCQNTIVTLCIVCCTTWIYWNWPQQFIYDPGIFTLLRHCFAFWMAAF